MVLIPLCGHGATPLVPLRRAPHRAQAGHPPVGPESLAHRCRVCRRGDNGDSGGGPEGSRGGRIGVIIGRREKCARHARSRFVSDRFEGANLSHDSHTYRLCTGAVGRLRRDGAPPSDPNEGQRATTEVWLFNF